jgi:hypothetical protein
VFKRLTRENGVLMVIFIDKEQIDNQENANTTRKPHGHIDRVRAFGFIMGKEDYPNLYKFESAKELGKWSLNG